MSDQKGLITELENGVLTEPMDFGTEEYENFKLLIRGKVSETPKKQRIHISLLGLKFHMQDYLKSNVNNKKVGSFIKQFIELVEIKQIEFANYLELRPSNLSKLLSGERRLNIELALILEKLSNIEADLWLRVQNHNELLTAQKTLRKKVSKYKLAELIK
jgi:addiction module HigA family antidote